MAKKSRRKKPSKERMPFVARTFEGLPGEGDWVALREFVPSATAVVTLTDGTAVRICSLLPGGGAGLVRPDGEIWVGLQVRHNFGDISRDLAHVIELGRESTPATPLRMSDPGVGARLQDLVDPASDFTVELHEDFRFWLVDDDLDSPQAAAALEQANAAVSPTRRLHGVGSAYLSTLGERTYLRWVMPEPESVLLDALARLHVDGTDSLGEGTRLIGMFRAHGLLVPVWEIDGPEADLDAEARAFADRLAATLADESPLTTEQRSARQGLTNRQLTIR